MRQKIVVSVVTLFFFSVLASVAAAQDTTCFTFRVCAGCNMFSIPFVPIDYYPLLSEDLPVFDTICMEYMGGYVPADTILAGYGYLGYSSIDTSFTICGVPVLGYTILLTGGWNLIGSPVGRYPVSEFVTIPPDCISCIFYYDDFTHTHIAVDTIEAGKGYNVLVAEDCTLSVGGNSPPYFFPCPGDTSLDIGEMLRLPLNIVDFNRDSVEVCLTTAPDGAYLDGDSLLIWEATGSGDREFLVSANDGEDTTLCGFVVHLPDRVEEAAATPEGFGIKSIKPNPFNSSVEITYTIPENVSGNIELAMFDILGRRTESLPVEKTKGEHSVIWQPQDVSSGIYFVRMKAGKQTITKKVMYLK